MLQPDYLRLILAIAACLFAYRLIDFGLNEISYFFQSREREKPPLTDILPWELLAEEIDVFSAEHEDYLLEALRTYGSYKDANQLSFLFLQLETVIASETASVELLGDAKTVLLQHLFNCWPR